MPDGDTAELDRRLAEVEALRKRVLNVIPHALRTPITTFRGLAEALPSASAAEVADEIVPALRRLAAQAEHLLDDMLIAAGYTTALPTGSRTATPVVATVREVWADCAPEAANGRDLEVDGDEGVAVLAPWGSLRKILVHVLDNAVKYGEGLTCVRVVAHDERVVVEVETAGASVPDLAMFVEPFYRGERAVTQAPGLGVGLTVARALAEQAGGSLDVAAVDGGGLVTRLELDAAR